MKKSLIVLFIISIVIGVTGCEKFISFEFLLADKYDSVYCYIPDKRVACVKDTTIYFSKGDLRLLLLRDWKEGIKHGEISLGSGTIDNLFDNWQSDTVSFFIFDRDTVDLYPWDYIIQNYCVLQRYDFSKTDLEQLKCQISYPPTEEMSKIQMFPPYRD
jgi:hypothetical protein